jgi:hypothetical protein
VSLDLSTYKPVSGTSGDAAQIANGFQAIQDYLNALEGATVASTVAGLGGGAAGQIGMLRLGLTPFDFVVLVYDSTYGKWVSQPLSFHTPVAGGTALSGGRADYVTAAGPILYNAAVMTAAGLTVQVRHAALLSLAPASSATSRILYRLVTDGSGASTYGADTSAVTANAADATSGNWENLTTPPTHTQLGVSVNLTAGSGTIFGVTHYVRFIG